ncbi:hypothetical protein Tco_1476061 [Tanacetum coccineum]
MKLLHLKTSPLVDDDLDEEEAIKKGHISIEKVPSVDNIADILNKPLKRESFNYLRLGLKAQALIPLVDPTP